MSKIQKAGRFILMLWGAPAAGKTTVARHLLAELRRQRGLTLPHLSTDQLNRAILGDDFVGEVRHALYDGLIAMAGSILGSGGGVLLDGTFLYPEMRQRIKNLARERRAVLVSVQVECSLPTRRQRNTLRPDDERVPEEWLERAHFRALANRFHSDLSLDTEKLTTEQSVDRILELLSWRLERGNRFPGLIRQVMPGKVYCAGL